MFRKDRQTEGESVAQFVTRLRQLTNLWEFGDLIAHFISNQVVDSAGQNDSDEAVDRA
jgi:hypothetical protein